MDNSQSDSSAIPLSNSNPSLNQDSSVQTSTTASVETPNVDPQLMFDFDFSNITLPTETSDDITSNTSNTSKIETSVTNTTNSSTNNQTSDLKQSHINLPKSSSSNPPSSSEDTSTQNITLPPTNNILSTSPLITQPSLTSINPPINSPLPLPLIPQVYPFPLNTPSSPLSADILKNIQKYPNFKAAIPRNQPFKQRPPKVISPVTSSPRPPLISNPLAAAAVGARKTQPLLQSRLPNQPLTPNLSLKSTTTNPVINPLANPLATNLANPASLVTLNNIDLLNPFYNTTLEQLKPEFKTKFTEDFNKYKLGQMNIDQFITKTKEYLSLKQHQTLQNLKIQMLAKPLNPAEELINSTKKRKLEENNAAAFKKAKAESNASINYMGPPPSRINQLFPIDTPGIGGNKVSSTMSKAAPEIDVTKLDSESLGDVMKYVGVDLKEETDNILRDNEILNMQQQQINQTDDRSKAQSFLSIPYMSKMVEEIITKNDITKVDPDYYNCLALAAQEKIRGLVEQMILASKHRVGLLHDYFMEESKAKNTKVADGEETYEFSVVIKDDVKKSLQLIERHERDKERKERQRRGEEEDRGDGKDGDPSKGGSSKRKKNKTIKNKDVPDAVKQRITNETALRAAGGSGKKYSWMTQSSNDEWRASSSLHFHKSSSQSKGDGLDKKSGDEGKGFDGIKRGFGSSKSGKSSGGLSKKKDGHSSSSSKNRNALRRTISQKDMYRVILKDAIFILEQDKFYKRSDLLYKWYTM